MKKILYVILACSLFISCKKNQLGGNAEIKGKVIHHAKAIPDAAIYVKFNATEFPGVDVTKYDHQLKADSEGNYSLEMYKGDYYLYAIGFDHSIGKQVDGGVPVKVRPKEKITADIAVTEQH